jgi:5-methylcytosine-specific restriction enzyme subunit McrC
MSEKERLITVFEYETVRVGKGLTPPQYKALQAYYGEKGVPYFTLINNGVRFCQYVGVLQIGNFTIEILPKADKSNDELNGKLKWKQLLIGMLREVGAIKIHAPSNSDLKLTTNSILDLYLELYLTEIEFLLHRGLVKRYRKTEGNTMALKGSLQFGKNIQQNLAHQERFYVNYTTYDAQHSIHSILYKALRLVKQINTNSALQSRIGALLLNFPEMPDLKVSEAIFEKISYNRKDEHYQKAIEIARLLLLNYHPDVSTGHNNVLALMFDMNVLWEQFVYVSLKKEFKKQNKNDLIETQSIKHFWQSSNKNKSHLEADIVINKGRENCVVLDTKWKNIGNSTPSPEDLRQMYAYHIYFDAKKVALVYPNKTHDITQGNYLKPNKITIKAETDELKECAIILITTENTISNWQKTIFNEINKWIDPSIVH